MSQKPITFAPSAPQPQTDLSTPPDGGPPSGVIAPISTQETPNV
jgi:hypothetical protein